MIVFAEVLLLEMEENKPEEKVPVVGVGVEVVVEVENLC